MWLDVRQSSAEWCWGLKRFTTLTTGPWSGRTNKDWRVIRWEANIDRLYYPPILLRNKAKHKLRYLTEIKMWENTRRSHKLVPNLSQIRLAICQPYQNISLSITQNICSTRSPGLRELRRVITVSLGWWLTPRDCSHSLPCQLGVYSFINFQTHITSHSNITNIHTYGILSWR